MSFGSLSSLTFGSLPLFFLNCTTKLTLILVIDFNHFVQHYISFCAFFSLLFSFLPSSLPFCFYLTVWASSSVFSCWEWHPENSEVILGCDAFFLLLYHDLRGIQTNPVIRRPGSVPWEEVFLSAHLSGPAEPHKAKTCGSESARLFLSLLRSSQACLSSWLPAVSLARSAPMSVTHLLTVASWTKTLWVSAFNLEHRFLYTSILEMSCFLIVPGAAKCWK